MRMTSWWCARREKMRSDRSYELIRTIMERLELMMHPTKTRIVGFWSGEEGFDFLGMHHRKIKAETLKHVFITQHSNG